MCVEDDGGQPPATGSGRIDSRADIADLYSRVAADYADKGPPYFAIAGKRLVELADVQSGDAVLDLGTGRGAVLIPAAQRVGPGGRTLGIDIAPGMLEQTRDALEKLGLHHATLRQVDASRLDVDLSEFSHVLSSFSVFFFPDLEQLLRRLHRGLRSTAVVGFAFTRGHDPRWTWYEELLRGTGVLEQLPETVGYANVRAAGVLVGLLEAAGFTDAHEHVEMTDVWYASPEAWWASLWTHGSRRPLERMPADALAQLQLTAMERVRAMAEPRGVLERAQLVYVIARRP